MKVFPRRLLAAFCLEFLVCAGAVLWIHKLSRLNNRIVWSLHAHTLYLYCGTGLVGILGLTIALSKLFPLLPKKETVRIGPLRQRQLRRIRELVCAAKRGSLIYIMTDCPDFGSLISFVEHRRLLWEIRMARTRRVAVKFLFLGEPALISRGNPLFNRTEDFEVFKRTTQFRQFMRFFPGISDPTADQFKQLMRRYMKRLLEDYADWGTDVLYLPSEHAKNVGFFLFRVAHKLAYIKLPSGAGQVPEAFETSDRHVVESMTEQFAHLCRIAERG